MSTRETSVFCCRCHRTGWTELTTTHCPDPTTATASPSRPHPTTPRCPMTTTGSSSRDPRHPFPPLPDPGKQAVITIFQRFFPAQNLNFLGFSKNYSLCRPAACKKFLLVSTSVISIAGHQKWRIFEADLL